MNAIADRSSCEMLVTCMPALAAFIHNRVRDRDFATEVLQEVSLRVLCGVPPRDHDSFVRWSCGIARHVIGSEWHRRGRARREQSLDDEIMETMSDPLPTADRRIAARDMLLLAIGEDRETLAFISRRYLESFNSVELGKQAGITSAAIRMRLSRLRLVARRRTKDVSGA